MVRMRFQSVDNLEEALDVLAQTGDETQILAGGSDVMVQHQRGEIHPEALLHIERIKDLRSVVADNAHLTVGALTTHRYAATDEVIRLNLPALSEASATVGGWQTQEVGTIVGNVVNASPAADTIPPLLNAGCVVQMSSTSGHRSEALSDFLVGRRQTTRRPDEIVTALELEAIGPRTGEHYIKVGPRSAMEVALVGLAVRLTIAPDHQTVEDARVAICSVAPVPYRAKEAESILIDSTLSDETVLAAGQALERSATPIDDSRATAAYRRRVLAPLLRRAVGQARNRVLQASS
jgi:carbon-monoxide dehydrogenase medium subunit